MSPLPAGNIGPRCLGLIILIKNFILAVFATLSGPGEVPSYKSVSLASTLQQGEVSVHFTAQLFDLLEELLHTLTLQLTVLGFIQPIEVFVLKLVLVQDTVERIERLRVALFEEELLLAVNRLE